MKKEFIEDIRSIEGFKFFGEDEEEDKKIMEFLLIKMVKELEKGEEPGIWEKLLT